MTSRMTGHPSGPAQPKAAVLRFCSASKVMSMEHTEPKRPPSMEDLRWGVGKDPAGEDFHHLYTPHTSVYIHIYIYTYIHFIFTNAYHDFLVLKTILIDFMFL